MKQGAPLQSPRVVTETSLANLFTGVLMNCRVFLESWSEYVLSVAAWLRIGLLCRHNCAMAGTGCAPLKQVARCLSMLRTTDG